MGAPRIDLIDESYLENFKSLRFLANYTMWIIYSNKKEILPNMLNLCFLHSINSHFCCSFHQEEWRRLEQEEKTNKNQINSEQLWKQLVIYRMNLYTNMGSSKGKKQSLYRCICPWTCMKHYRGLKKEKNFIIKIIFLETCLLVCDNDRNLFLSESSCNKYQ